MDMANMNAQNIAALLTAVAGLVTAIGAIWHSNNTRKALVKHHNRTKVTNGPTRPSGTV